MLLFARMETPGTFDNLFQVRSSLSGVVWPGVPDHPGALQLALQFQFERTQWWAPDELRRHQLRELAALLRHAYASMPFWRERLSACGYEPGGNVTPEWFARLPVLIRGDIREQGEALRCRDVPPAHGRVTKGQTSGSTGMPITYYGTELTRLLWHAFTLRDHLWHRRDLSGKLAAIRRGVQQSRRRGWGPSTDAAFRTGECVGYNSSTDLDAQLEWLQVEAPAYLITQAYNLFGLARRSVERGIRLPGLREARCFGGTFPDDTRELCRRAWGVPVVDIYSAEEAGYLALQCPAHEHYHAQAENLLLEILDERGNACAPGEIGRVVLTTLHNYAMPLIRYDLGDYAEAGGPCPCGRGLPVISRILGRQRNLLTLPGGRQRWPSFPSKYWSGLAPVRQLQLVQKSVEEIVVRVVAERALTAGEQARLVEALQGCLGHAFRMPVEQLGEIPRSASHKFEDFVSEIA